jgi:hypothetical protein
MAEREDTEIELLLNEPEIRAWLDPHEPDDDEGDVTDA